MNAPPIIIRQTGAADQSITLEERGVGLVVRSGGQAGGRIWFDRQTEDRPGQNSVEMTDGTAILRKFDRLILTWPAQVNSNALELEIHTCATAVYVLGQEPNGVGAKLVHKAATVVETLTTETIFAEPALESVGELEFGVWRYRRERFVGGAVSATQPVTLTAYHRISTSRRVRIADLQITVADADGRYSASLETGWRRRYDTFGSNTQTHMHGPLLPWPRGGLEIDVTTPGATDATIEALIYART